jgi:hypothetical protein
MINLSMIVPADSDPYATETTEFDGINATHPLPLRGWRVIRPIGELKQLPGKFQVFGALWIEVGVWRGGINREVQRFTVDHSRNRQIAGPQPIELHPNVSVVFEELSQ